MTTYYGFQHQHYSPQSMNVDQRVPDARFESTIEQDMQEVINAPTTQISPCCTKPPPCRTWIEWKPEFSDCAPTFVNWSDLQHQSNQPNQDTFANYEIGQKDSRIWVGDLNGLHYNRQLVSGASWWSESTQPHIRNRQLFAQYLQSTMYPKSSPHEKRIDRVQDSYVALRHRFGPQAIQYTSF